MSQPLTRQKDNSNLIAGLVPYKLVDTKKKIWCFRPERETTASHTQTITTATTPSAILPNLLHTTRALNELFMVFYFMHCPQLRSLSMPSVKRSQNCPFGKDGRLERLSAPVHFSCQRFSRRTTIERMEDLASNPQEDSNQPHTNQHCNHHILID